MWPDPETQSWQSKRCGLQRSAKTQYDYHTITLSPDSSVSDPDSDWIRIQAGKIVPQNEDLLFEESEWPLSWFRKTRMTVKKNFLLLFFLQFCHIKSWSGSGLDPDSAKAWIRIWNQQNTWIRKQQNTWIRIWNQQNTWIRIQIPWIRIQNTAWHCINSCLFLTVQRRICGSNYAAVWGGREE